MLDQIRTQMLKTERVRAPSLAKEARALSGGVNLKAYAGASGARDSATAIESDDENSNSVKPALSVGVIAYTQVDGLLISRSIWQVEGYLNILQLCETAVHYFSYQACTRLTS